MSSFLPVSELAMLLRAAFLLRNSALKYFFFKLSSVPFFFEIPRAREETRQFRHTSDINQYSDSLEQSVNFQTIQRSHEMKKNWDLTSWKLESSMTHNFILNTEKKINWILEFFRRFCDICHGEWTKSNTAYYSGKILRFIRHAGHSLRFASYIKVNAFYLGWKMGAFFHFVTFVFSIFHRGERALLCCSRVEIEERDQASKVFQSLTAEEASVGIPTVQWSPLTLSTFRSLLFPTLGIGFCHIEMEKALLRSTGCTLTAQIQMQGTMCHTSWTVN